MTRVDFYILQQNATTSLHFCCRLIAKAYHHEHQILVYFDDPNRMQMLDDLLWTFNDISFIPHAQTNEKIEKNVPIRLSCSEFPEYCDDILLNLSNQNIENIMHFKRIIEIVPNEEPWKGNARERFKYYREKQCKINTHNI